MAFLPADGRIASGSVAGSMTTEDIAPSGGAPTNCLLPGIDWIVNAALVRDFQSARGDSNQFEDLMNLLREDPSALAALNLATVVVSSAVVAAASISPRPRAATNGIPQ